MNTSRRNLGGRRQGGGDDRDGCAARWSPAQFIVQSSSAQTSPDLIVHNAKVTTLQNGRGEVQAFAVRGEKIVAVGGDGEILTLRAANTRVIDAGGRRVVPASTTTTSTSCAADATTISSFAGMVSNCSSAASR